MKTKAKLIAVALVCVLSMTVSLSADAPRCTDCQKSFPEDYNYCPYCSKALVKDAPVGQDVTTNSIGMKLRHIRPGEFWMGRPTEEEGDSDELPRHLVRLTRGFYMGTTEVTQGQWSRVMGTQPWSGQSCVKEGSDYPATYVSWEDTVAFCKRLSEQEGHHYRLPTEAEWEYACRAGTGTAYSFGDDVSELGDYAWFGKNAYNTGERYAHAVAQKKPNPWGLYDMHGNVWEWCSDFLRDYAKDPVTNPQGPDSGSLRVHRGGGWSSTPWLCRSALRARNAPGLRNHSIGFRLVLDSIGAKPVR